MYGMMQKKFLFSFLLIIFSYIGFLLSNELNGGVGREKELNKIAVAFLKCALKNLEQKKWVDPKKPHDKDYIPIFPFVVPPPPDIPLNVSNLSRSKIEEIKRFNSELREIRKIPEKIGKLIDERKIVLVVKSERYRLILPERIDGFKILHVKSFDKLLQKMAEEKSRWYKENKDKLHWRWYGFNYFIHVKPYLFVDIREIEKKGRKYVLKSMLNTKHDLFTYYITAVIKFKEGKWVVVKTYVKSFSRF